MTETNHQDLSWRAITRRRELVILQQFTCTSDRPRTPHGRILPHPRPWEWDVQRHLRALAHHLRPSEAALLGWRGDHLAAAAHVIFTEDDDAVEAFVAAVAVSVAVRGEGGSIADATMAEIWNRTCARAVDRGAGEAFLTEKISTRNLSAQKMAERCGQEPVGLPSGELQLWIRRDQVT